MFSLTAKIEVKSDKVWTFTRIGSVEITRDSETLTDSCVLQLPKKVRWQGEDKVPLKRGDEVVVSLGYNGDLKTVFKGYVTEIGLKSPVTISCEDYFFKIKQQAAKKLAYRSATIGKVLEDQQLGIRFKVSGEEHLGQFRVTADTVSGLLGQLKDSAGVRSFIRLEDGEPVLYCGVVFETGSSYGQVFETGLNLIDDSGLKTMNAADVKMKVKAVSMLPNNEKVEAEAGDDGGVVQVLKTNGKGKAELKAWAEQELKRLKRDGLTGSFTTFGAVVADKLDHVALKIDGERKGVYQVEKNVVKFSSEGFRQEITIGARVAE